MQSAPNPGSVRAFDMRRIDSLCSFPLELVPLFLVIACSAKTGTTPAEGAVIASVSPPAFASAPPLPPVASASATQAPVNAAAPTPSGAPSVPPAVASAEAPPPTVPAVKVHNIGMHIGGGPNDAITKEPIRRSVEPHFDEFRRCFGLLEDGKKAGDFGIDLRIDRAGGKARVSHPRTTFKGKPFADCVVHTYESIDFLKPRGGTTTVSYSLRFTP